MSPFQPLLAFSPLSPLERLLESVLISIHETTGFTWAWSIIALTLVVRLVILPIDVKQKRSMLAMQRLQPYVKQLQQKYKDDRQALNVAMMEFYRSNKVNPLASCFPILLQAPVFIALFFVLKDVEAFAGKSDNYTFLFGFVDNIRTNINDAGWVGAALVVFYVASQMLASAVMNTSPDPRQRMIFMLLPVAFVPLIINFPIGVMLYWITTNLWTLALHLVVLRFTNHAQEVILPEDAKGNRKVVLPKSAKAEMNRRKASTGAASKSSGKTGQGSPAQGQPGARRNKRRR